MINGADQQRSAQIRTNTWSNNADAEEWDIALKRDGRFELKPATNDKINLDWPGDRRVQNRYLITPVRTSKLSQLY